jgi:hypothetical protein
MRQCQFCSEPVEETARKCKTCGEPFYFFGKVLKVTPVLSILVTAGSLGIAFVEIEGRQTAEKARQVITSELKTKDRAASRALNELAQKLPEQEKKAIVKNLRLEPDMTLERLQQHVDKEPENADLQKRLYIYQAVKPTE